MTSESKTDDFSLAESPLWQPPPGLPEPARQVWLAGLGALSRAQAEGGKAFEALARQGLALQTQASEAARERIAEVTQAAAQPWERLSGIFEDRVAHALARLGLPTAQDWAALQARVQALEAALHNISRAPPQSAPRSARAKSTAKPTAQPAAPKSPVRAAPSKKIRTSP
jgi:poly(hydroxyalkanoate) granule-associated protein